MRVNQCAVPLWISLVRGAASSSGAKFYRCRAAASQSGGFLSN